MSTHELIAQAIAKAGGLNRLARAMGVTTNAVAQWRDGRALPEWFRANRLSELTGEDLDAVQRTLIAAHQERSERRRRWQGGSAASSGWNSARRPLTKADHTTEPLGTTGAERLHRLAPARA